MIKGGNWFVGGASALARRFHLPELLIGATVVSIGTTLPEVRVSTMSALSGHGEIAYGFGKFTRPVGFILLAMFVAYMIANVMQMKKARLSSPPGTRN